MTAVAEGPARSRSASSCAILSMAAEPWLAVVVLVTAALGASASVIRHVHLESGVDVAIFDQAVWHYSHLQAPFSSIKGEDLLGDHFHPLVALLAPLYWVWSDPRALLIAQAVLVAGSIVPVFIFTKSRLGRGGAYLLAIAYAAFWGIQVGTLFEFHEVAFAPLLIALAILLADERRWIWLWVVVAMLLCVKEDLSFFVIFLGVYLMTVREFRQGIALVLIGAGWYELVTRVFMPDLAGGTTYAYWSYGELGRTPLDAVWALIRAPWRLVTIGFSPSEKARTIALLFAPFLFFSLGSRLIILAIPLLAERFLSTNPAFWSTHFHYSLTIAPVLAMSAAAGLSNLTRVLPARRRRLAIALGAAAMLIASVAVTRIATSDSALTQMTRPSFFKTPGHAAAVYRALAHVPASASLATADTLLPHASERDHIEQLDAAGARLAQFIVVNALHISCCGVGENSSYAALGKVVNSQLLDMTPVYYDSGWIVLRRPTPGRAATNGAVTPARPSTARELARATALWMRSVGTAYGRLAACYRTGAARGTDTRRCYAEAARDIETPEPRMIPRIRAALPTLTGGCAQLAAGAAIVSGKITAYLKRIAAVGESADPRSVASEFVALRNYSLAHDPFGLIERFTLLCRPR